jgi:tetratricopeptide (TPR) repeat protein
MADKYRSEILIGLALLGLTLLAFGRICSCDFVNYDDDLNVTANPYVLAGLTCDSIRWAWTNQTGLWHPLTWMSLQLDHDVYGLNPGGFHRTNLWLHAVNGVLVFWVLRRLTGAIWRSAAVAALFVLHPMHVESVAWVTERKSLLSTFFGLLALGGYAAYGQRPGLLRYLLVLGTFVFSLLAKPTLVTLPGLLLLLDYWPLRRLQVSTIEDRKSKMPPFPRLLLEKAPFLIISGGMACVTIQAEKNIGTLADPNAGDLLMRLGAAAVTYVKYLGQTFWPSALTVFYPRHLDGYSTLPVISALIVLIGLTVLTIRVSRQQPYTLVGWLWFLGALVPVIGIWQVGWHERADRYTYVPHIGLFVALVWGGHELARRILQPRIDHGWNMERNILTFGLSVFGLALMGCFLTTWKQIDYWKNDRDLWEHNVAVQPGSWVGHNNLGASLQSAGILDDAESHFRTAIELFPGYWSAHRNLGNLCMTQGRLVEAEEQFREAVRIDPRQEMALQELGALLWYQGKRTEAIEWFTKVLQINPQAPNPHNMLGLDLLIRRKPADAEQHFRHALRFLPDEAELHANLGAALFNQGMLPEAIEQFSLAVQLKPEYASGHYKLAMALERQGRFDEAAHHFAEANRLDPHLPQHGSLRAN